ncbi:hypothetical protein [Marinomonas sp. THO17]|uniref:hypothetical protein n=1 Tax=Marinomonas sp. THO17 TaxID=3149048 RepID=UPI00336C10E7
MVTKADRYNLALSDIQSLRNIMRDNDNAVVAYRLRDKGNQFAQRVAQNERNHISPEGLFSDIQSALTGVQSYSDPTLINNVYLNHKALFDALYGGDSQSAVRFYSRYNGARKDAFRLLSVYGTALASDAFPTTYFHKDIFGLFLRQAKNMVHGTGDHYNTVGMFNEEYTKNRISSTASIVLRLAFGNVNYPYNMIWNPRSLVSTLQLSAMHHSDHIKQRFRDDDGVSLYNGSSVAFTLLTFSYFIARRMLENNESIQRVNNWYFYWKVVGSCLGLSNDHMPSNHAESIQLMNEFLQHQDTLVDIANMYNSIDDDRNYHMDQNNARTSYLAYLDNNGCRFGTKTMHNGHAADLAGMLSAVWGIGIHRSTALSWLRSMIVARLPSQIGPVAHMAAVGIVAYFVQQRLNTTA